MARKCRCFRLRGMEPLNDGKDSRTGFGQGRFQVYCVSATRLKINNKKINAQNCYRLVLVVNPDPRSSATLPNVVCVT